MNFILIMFLAFYGSFALALNNHSKIIPFPQLDDPEQVFSEDIPQLKRLNSFGIKRYDSNSRKYPGSAIGKVKTAKDGNCTAGLVDEWHIVSAAHCFFKKDKNGKKRLKKGDYVFYYSFHQGRYYDSAYITHIKSGWVDGSSTNPTRNDWVVAKLSKPLGKTYGYLGYYNRTHDILKVGTPLMLIGYGGQFWGGNTQSVSGNCSVKRLLPEHKYIYHDCTSSRGDSGAPLFVEHDNKYYIAGLEVSEYRDGADESLTLDKYSDKYANISIFVDQFNEHLAAARDGSISYDYKLNNRRQGEDKNYYTIRFKNNCNEKVSFAVRYRNLRNDWSSQYWWTVNPGMTMTPNVDNNRLKTTNTILYYYAESKSFDWGGSNSEKNRNFNVGKFNYRFRYLKEKKKRWGDFWISLSCNSSI